MVTVILAAMIMAGGHDTTLARMQSQDPAHSEVQVVRQAPDTQDRPIGIGVEMGVVVPPALGASFGAGIRGSYRFPIKDIHIRTGATIGFYGRSNSGSGGDARVGGNYSYAMDVFVLPIILDAALEIPAGPNVTPFAGIGVGSTWVRATESVFGFTNTESQFVGTFRIFAGADFPLGPGFVSPELRYSFANTDFLSTGSTNVGGIGLFVGYRFAL